MHIRTLGTQPYLSVFQQMKAFTTNRDSNTPDQMWVLEHPPIYTQGQAGKAEHLLQKTDIEVIQSDRGGQITYHGPGQMVAYVLMDLRRLNIGIRTLVCKLEQCIITLLKQFDIVGETRCGAPGVYVHQKKIASIGLRVKNACTYHGIALNVDMDLKPFSFINPCGFSRLEMTQMVDFKSDITMDMVIKAWNDICMRSGGLS